VLVVEKNFIFFLLPLFQEIQHMADDPDHDDASAFDESYADSTMNTSSDDATPYHYVPDKGHDAIPLMVLHLNIDMATITIWEHNVSAGGNKNDGGVGSSSSSPSVQPAALSNFGLLSVVAKEIVMTFYVMNAQQPPVLQLSIPEYSISTLGESGKNEVPVITTPLRTDRDRFV